MVPIYAKRIREIRQKQGMTQPEFAMVIGTTKNQISKYELNKEPIPVKHIIRICEEFCVSADWLLGIGEYKQEPTQIINIFSRNSAAISNGSADDKE